MKYLLSALSLVLLRLAYTLLSDIFDASQHSYQALYHKSSIVVAIFFSVLLISNVIPRLFRAVLIVIIGMLDVVMILHLSLYFPLNNQIMIAAIGLGIVIFLPLINTNRRPK